ncbi:hypothetical protein K1719_022095 [Acacia pycnantha]|nr:hypothetical protein K1719_022095 [Acacia pycnantha]
MKLPTFADPDSLSHIFSLLQSSFVQMNETNSSVTRKRRRKNDKPGDGDDDDSTQNQGTKKKELSGILTSLLLLEEQQKRDQEELDRVSEEEKLSLEANHKKKTKAMLEYYTNIQDYYDDAEESERIKRKKSRAMAGAVAVAAASDGLEKVHTDKVLKAGAGGGSQSQQRRLWVKDRSGACSGYPLMDWVLVPYTQQHLTWTQHAFNEKIGEVQKVAKDAFARLKGRNEEMDPELKFELLDDEMVPEVALRSASSMKARDAIAHNLLHHGLAGTSFL